MIVSGTAAKTAFSAQRSDCSPSVVSIWSNFVLLPSCHTILEVRFFAYLCELYFTGQALRSSKRFLASCFQLLVSEEVPRVVLLPKNQCLDSWNLDSRKKGTSTIHFNGDSINTELLFQTIHSVNQLSVNGAVAKLVSSIRFDRRRKRTSQSSCGQQAVNKVKTRTQDDQFPWVVAPFCWLYNSIVLSERKMNCHTTSLPTLDPRTSQCPCENLIA